MDTPGRAMSRCERKWEQCYCKHAVLVQPHKPTNPDPDAMSEHRPQPAAAPISRIFTRFQTRWMDNDVYGHVNNVVYYSWFDTAVNHYLVQRGVLDIEQGRDRAGHRNAATISLRRLSGLDRGRRAGGASGAAACATSWGSSRPARRLRLRKAISCMYVDRQRAGRWRCRRHCAAPWPR
jgi:hypothetical protein